MKSLLLAFALLTPTALGFLLVSLLWPKTKPFRSDLLLRLFLSIGVGFGVSSLLVFVWMMTAGQLSRAYFLCELGILVALSVLTLRPRSRPTVVIAPEAQQDREQSQNPYWLRAAVAVASISAAFQFVSSSLQNPHGQFDAYSIWNLRARFLYRGGVHWTDFKYLTWSHPDYPLFLPASIARCWAWMGAESKIIPIAIACLMTVATVGIVLLGVERLRSPKQGLLAGLVLLGTPFLLTHGAAQYADVPLSFFFTATLILFLLYDRLPSEPGWLILSGIAAGLAAWTKNEGALFVGAFFLSFCLATAVKQGMRKARGQILLWLAGAAPILLIIAIYKLWLGGSNDVVSAQGLASNAHNFLDLGGYRLLITRFATGIFTFGQWSRVLSMPILLVLYFLALGTNRQKDRKYDRGQVVSCVLPILMLMGYFFVYMISPYDVRWHLETSLNRLYLQLWPLMIIAYFMIVRTPEEALTKAPAEELHRDELVAQHASPTNLRAAG